MKRRPGAQRSCKKPTLKEQNAKLRQQKKGIVNEINERKKIRDGVESIQTKTGCVGEEFEMMIKRLKLFYELKKQELIINHLRQDLFKELENHSELQSSRERISANGVCLCSGDHRRVSLPCGHVYCEEFISTLLRQFQQCPRCKMNATIDQLWCVYSDT